MEENGLLVLELKELKFQRVEDKAKKADFFEFDGYLSTFGNVDLVDDVVVRGCFEESLRERMPKLLWQHDWKQPIGVFVECREDDKGLYVKGRLPMSDTFVAGRVIPQIEAGSVDSMSIGYSVKVAEYDMDTGIRYLKKVKLYEGSLVTLPANPEARVAAKKDLLNSYCKTIEIVSIDAPIVELTEDKKKEAEEKGKGLDVFVADGDKIKVHPKKAFAVKADALKQDLTKEQKAVMNKIYSELKLEEPYVEGKESTFCETEIRNLPVSKQITVIRYGKLSKSCSDYIVKALGKCGDTESETVKEQEKTIEEIKKLTKKWSEK